jgi:CPA2 family monovalent cation:H+ antiporter-2
MVRTRYVSEIDPLLALGANEVIPEEFETSIEIFSRVLGNYLIPVNEIEQVSYAIRSNNYEIFNTTDFNLEENKRRYNAK